MITNIILRLWLKKKKFKCHLNTSKKPPWFWDYYSFLDPLNKSFQGSLYILSTLSSYEYQVDIYASLEDYSLYQEKFNWNTNFPRWLCYVSRNFKSLAF